MGVSLMVGGSLRRRAVLAVVGLVAASVGVAVVPVAAADAVVATETGDALEVAGSLVADAVSVADVGDSFVATVAGSEVELPADPAEPLVLDGSGGEISVDLPVVPGGGDGVVDASGAVVYESDVSPVSFAAQATADGGMQVLVVIEGADAPTEYWFDMTVPAGAVFRATSDGGAEVVGADGQIVTAVAPPWALDANGQSVPTRYLIEGTTLVQVIDHHGASYPVVGDPKFGFGWNIYVRLSPYEQKTLIEAGIAGGAVTIGALVCTASVVGGPGAIAVCLGAIAAAAVVIWRTVDRHFNPSCWIELKFSYGLSFKGVGNTCWRRV
jgi:hypothetical protein